MEYIKKQMIVRLRQKPTWPHLTSIMRQHPLTNEGLQTRVENVVWQKSWMLVSNRLYQKKMSKWGHVLHKWPSKLFVCFCACQLFRLPWLLYWNGSNLRWEDFKSMRLTLSHFCPKMATSLFFQLWIKQDNFSNASCSPTADNCTCDLFLSYSVHGDEQQWAHQWLRGQSKCQAHL